MKSPHAAAAHPSGRRVPLALTSLVIALGLSAMLGWHLHNPRITQWVMGTKPNAYSAAVSLVVLGAALLAAILERRRLSAALAILGGLPSLLVLFEYTAGVSLGIDELLLKFTGLSVPGQIAPNAALCLLLLSVAILCMTTPAAVRWRTLGSPLLVSIALGISAVSVAGYLTGFATYGWGPLSPMAVPASAGLTLLSLALLHIYWREDRLSARGAPSWLYIAVTVAAMVMAVSLWQAVASEEHVRVERAVADQLEIVRVRLLSDLDFRIAAVTRFARRWERTGLPDRQQWDFEIGLLVKDVQGFEVIGWADPTFRIRWIYPQATNEALLDADLGTDAIRRTALETARDSRQTILTRPMQLLAGGTGINAYIPVYRGAAIQGFVLAGFRFQDLFPHLLDSAMAPGYAVAIYDGPTRIYFRAPPDEERGRVWQQQGPLQVENSRWILQLWPTPSALALVESTGSRIVLAAGLALAVLLGLAVYLAQAAHKKTGLAERARGELQREVAERQRVERELEEFFTVTPDMLCIAGFDGYFKRLNPAWVNALGWSVEQLLEVPYANFVHPDDGPATEGAAQQLEAGGSVVSFENRYRTRDGSYRWMRWNCRPSPERRLIFAAARDATVEKGVAEELRHGREELERRVRERTAELENTNRTLYEREELFRRLFEESPIGTVLAGLDRKINRVNQAFCHLLGYSASELTALTFDDITPVDDLARNVESYRRTYFSEMSASRLAPRYVRKDGKIVWVNLTASVIRDESGNPLTTLVMAEDITEHMIREDEISRLNLELQARIGELTEVNQELESFNYSVSHDLRAPLRHIDGFSKILLDQYAADLPADGRRSVERIRDGARRMGRMVDELLDLSRTSRREVSKEVTGLRTLLAEVLDDLKREVQDREIEWRIGGLPFADCDPTLVRQVFSNLLANAVKFTRHRRPAVIEVGQTVSRGQKVLFVRDNGVGFSMKYVDKLFGVFQRLHRQEDFEGTGVGLVTVQRIVHKHGGRIWAEAELEKGATFYFTLEPPVQPRPEEPGGEPAVLLAGEKE